MGVLSCYEIWHRSRATELEGDAEELEERMFAYGADAGDKADIQRLEEAHKKHLAGAAFAANVAAGLKRFHLKRTHHA
jgi:hypothetical protein